VTALLLMLLALGPDRKAEMLDEARASAERALADPRCASVHALVGVEPGPFDFDLVDGSGGDVCASRPGDLAVAAVGGRRVWACRPFFSKGPTLRAAVLIHEHLHTRGMTHRESPDGRERYSSAQVTLVVLDRCQEALR
jgi:hypothetical protein